MKLETNGSLTVDITSWERIKGIVIDNCADVKEYKITENGPVRTHVIEFLSGGSFTFTIDHSTGKATNISGKYIKVKCSPEQMKITLIG